MYPYTYISRHDLHTYRPHLPLLLQSQQDRIGIELLAMMGNYVYIYIHIYIYTYVPIYICMYMYVYVYIYTYIYIYIYTHTHTHIYIYIPIHALPPAVAEPAVPDRDGAGEGTMGNYLYT